MQINKNYIIIGLIIFGTIMVWMNINKKDLQTGKDYEFLVDSLEQHIAVQELVIEKQYAYSDSLESANTLLDASYDSLSTTKQKVKHHYHDVYKDINIATNTKLDSIIRANWR